MKNLGELTDRELGTLAKEQRIAGYSKLRKDQLIAQLTKGTPNNSAEFNTAVPYLSIKTPKKQTQFGKSSPRGCRLKNREIMEWLSKKRPRTDSTDHGDWAHISEDPALTDSYGDGKIELLPRDSNWLYCYWDPTHLQRKALKNASRPVLLVFLLDELLQETEMDRIPSLPQAKSWYFHVDQADRTYRCSLGIELPDGSVTRLLTSNFSTTPPDTVSSRNKWSCRKN